MNDLWLTIKAWIKGLIFAAIVLYSILFIYNNSGEPVQFWWWFKRTHPTSVFFLASGAFLVGMVFTVILQTSWKTWRQINEIRVRSRTGKLERSMAEVKAKAAMLQTRPAAPDGMSAQVDKLGEPHQL